MQAWRATSGGITLSEDFIREFRYLLNFQLINRNQKHLSPSFLAEFNHFQHEYVEGKKISSIFYTVTEEEILENVDKMDWESLGNCQNLSQKVILQITKKIMKNWHKQSYQNTWESLCSTQNIPEDLIVQYKDSISFNWLSSNQKLSCLENIIRKYPNENYDWHFIPKYFSLSEDFIEEFKHKL